MFPSFISFVYVGLKTNVGNQDVFEDVASQKKSPGKSVWTIVYASTTDSGFYICTAENSINKIQTNGIVLSISGKRAWYFN